MGTDRTGSTLVSKRILKNRALKEGVDPSKIITAVPRWAETAPHSPGVKSALVRGDLIIRSDGSTVALDGMIGMDSYGIMAMHSTTKDHHSFRSMLKRYFPEVKEINLSAPKLRQKVLRIVGWNEYVKRLTSS